MSAAINAVAFAGWETSVSSAAHAGWLLGAEAPVVTPPARSLGEAFPLSPEQIRRREEEELISLVIALHERRLS